MTCCIPVILLANMMAPWQESAFHITDNLCGETIRRFPSQKVSSEGFGVFFVVRLKDIWSHSNDHVVTDTLFSLSIGKIFNTWKPDCELTLILMYGVIG